MLPTFSRHLRHYSIGLWAGLSLICLLLTFTLVRNAGQLSLLELLLAGGAIIAGVTYATVRDAPGYWIYAARAPKFMLMPSELAAVRQLKVTMLARLLNPLRNPWATPLVLAAALLPVLLVGAIWLPEQRAVLAFVAIGGLFPLMLAIVMAGSAPYLLALASPEGEAMLRAGLAGRRAARTCLYEDLAISLAINFALVWPLHDQPAFSLERGYANPEFIVAAVILAWIAAFFTLLGARRSRVFSATGEALAALVEGDLADGRYTAPKLGAWQRSLAYYALLAGWALAACLLFSLLPPGAPFPVFYLSLLVPLGLMFWRERLWTLQQDARQVAEFFGEFVPASAR